MFDRYKVSILENVKISPKKCNAITLKDLLDNTKTNTAVLVSDNSGEIIGYVRKPVAKVTDDWNLYVGCYDAEYFHEQVCPLTVDLELSFLEELQSVVKAVAKL